MAQAETGGSRYWLAELHRRTALLFLQSGAEPNLAAAAFERSLATAAAQHAVPILISAYETLNETRVSPELLRLYADRVRSAEASVEPGAPLIVNPEPSLYGARRPWSSIPALVHRRKQRWRRSCGCARPSASRAWPDITGLDRVGIPVVQVTRPHSLSNTVAQGKGASLGRAAISAILETAESFFAERIERFDTVLASAAALDLPHARFDFHLRDDVAADWRDRVTAWVAADDLLGSGRHLVPVELVHTAYIVPPNPTDGIFIGHHDRAGGRPR